MIFAVVMVLSSGRRNRGKSRDGNGSWMVLLGGCDVVANRTACNYCGVRSRSNLLGGVVVVAADVLGGA